MKKTKLLKSLLVAAALLVGANAWAQTTWTFLNNTTVWGADGVTLSGGAQYDENASAVTSGGVTFTGTSGFVATAKGIGFNATGSTTDENISLVVPVGYKATVSIFTSSNRTVVADFGGAIQTFNASWTSTTKEFNNAEGTEDITLYLYCNQNPGGAEQNKAPFLETIVLTDMSSIKSFPWTANAVATIGGTKTTIKTYSSEADVDEGSQYTVVVDKVIKYEDNYYVLSDSQFAENVFGATFTMGSEAPTLEFNYVELENVAFYGEVEDIYSAGSKANKQTNINVLSNGGGYSAMGTSGYVTIKFSVPETAVYNLALGMNNTNSSNRGFNYAIDDADVSETITVGNGKAFVQEIKNQPLEAGEHTMTLNITYSLTPIFDYLLVTNTPKYYIAGSMTDWEAGVSDYQLTLNEASETTEYMITLSLNSGDEFKVVGVLGETNTWYPDGSENNYYVSADGTYDVYFRPNGDGDDSWHYNCIYAALKPTYTVAGSNSELFGTAWDTTNTDNDMTENADGTYSITYTGVELDNENVEYKVVKNHSWDTAYPESNRVIGISMAGIYDITITFDPSAGTVNETMAIYKDITDAGYATYCSPYDLNFDGTGITAYIAKIEGTDVTFEEVTSAPANTGLLLKADEGSYPIAMETSSTTIENNALIGVLEATHVDKGAFVLMDGTEGVGFYKTNNDEGFTVGANTAYIAATSTARSFIAINFDGTTTAIEGVATQSVNNGVVYDLQGRRVAAPQSGLYIINGKKVVIK